MHVDLRDQVIVVTGGGSGLGRELCIGLAREGARIAVLDNNTSAAGSTVEAIREHAGAQAEAVTADVSDEEQVAAAARSVMRRWGRVDALISNAGWLPGPTPVLELELPVLTRILHTNLVGAFLVTKHFAPLMISGGGGRVIYMSSDVGGRAGPGLSAYGAGKAGINLLSSVVHAELADQGIRTVALAPGLTDTPGLRASMSAAYIEQVSARYPNGRLGRPEDVVGLAAFLCGPEANHLSGTLLAMRA